MSLFGLVVGAVVLASGGTAEVRDGVIEFRDGFAPRFLRLPVLRAKAMTLGHVILARDTPSVDSCRGHEHGHVQQMERWGIVFVPAYAVASLWAAWHGGHWYRDNWFERDADRRCAVDPTVGTQ